MILDSTLETPIRVLHAGSLEIAGHEPVYADLLRRGICEVVGVDPCEDEDHRTASVRAGRFSRYSGATLGDGAERLFRVCQLRSRSSLFEPNHRVTRLYDGLGEGSQVVERRIVKTERLDGLFSDDFDLIVLDLQGGELMTIEGGPKTVSNALVVHTEVEIVEQYVGQPLWAEVDQALGRRGFVMHTVFSYGSRPMLPFAANDARLTGFRQWLWADAVYVRRLETLPGLPRPRLLKFALVVHSLYQSYDLAHYILMAADPRIASDYRANL